MSQYSQNQLITKAQLLKKHANMLRVILISTILYYPIMYFGLNNFTSENDAVWFQRSGSVLVFLSISIHFLYIKSARMITDIIVDFGDEKPRTLMQDYSENKKGLCIRADGAEPTFGVIFESIAFIFGAYGTIVWGYGDLFYYWLK